MAEATFRDFEDGFTLIISNLKTKLTSIAATQSGPQSVTYIKEADELVTSAERKLKDLDRHLRHQNANTTTAVKKAIESKKANCEREFKDQRNTLAEFKKKLQSSSMQSAQEQEWRDQRVRLLQNKDIVDESSASLLQTERIIQDTIVIGVNTSVTLEQQTEQMEGMRDTLHETDAILDKSKKVLMRMRRRLVTNKLMTVMIILLELAIAALIIYIRFYS